MTTVNRSTFAQLLGCSKPYVTQLVTQQRVVLTADGKLVEVEKSFELLNVTADPSKVGVRERWDAYRKGIEAPGTATAAAAVVGPAPASLPEQLGLDAAPAVAPTPAAPPPSSAYHDARTQREQAQARMAQVELGKVLGTLLEAEPALKAVMDAHTAARAEIMKLPDRLAQLVAAQSTPRACYELIRAECERCCARIVEAARGLASAEQIARAQADQTQPAEVPA